MDIKVLLCNCKGLCDPFKAADMNTLPFAVESDLDVQYSVLHPQLCGQGDKPSSRTCSSPPAPIRMFLLTTNIAPVIRRAHTSSNRPR